jgi:hypothetical protein
MSREILILENKVLKLKNTLIRKFKIDDEPLEKKLHMFESYLKIYKIETFGPIILKTHIEGTDLSELVISAIIQVKSDKPKLLSPYKFENEIKVGPCLFSRFEGKEQYANIAQCKMQVYAYENNIILGTESYSIYKERNEKYSVIDTFVPIVGSEKI